MIDLNELKKYIKNHPDEVSAILDSDRALISNAPEVKLLHSFLFDFWNERPNKTLTFIFYFKENIIEKLQLNKISANFNELTEKLKTHRIIEVDTEFKIISTVTREINQDFLLDLSNQQNVVFFFAEQGIDVIVKGKIFPRINVFYDESDRLKYSKKFHISELSVCFKEYEKYVNEPGINEAFFASKPLISKIQRISPPLNTLINKPENTLRNNLLGYLNRHTQHDFTKEIELNDKRELDLYTEVDGKKYLIEVKWLGQTINDTDTGFSQRVTDVSARDGVTQTLEYIQHLIEKMSFNVHCGYLCVFDAREDKRAIRYNGFNFVRPELLPYYNNHFKKLDEVSINRTT